MKNGGGGNGGKVTEGAVVEVAPVAVVVLFVDVVVELTPVEELGVIVGGGTAGGNWSLAL